jgi:hypothetical protein
MIEQTSGSELDSASLGLRERIAQHVAGVGAESNYEVMCLEVARRRTESRVDCPECDGLGFRAVSSAELAAFEARMAKKQEDGAGWKTLKDERWRFNRESVCRPCKGTGRILAQRAEALRPDSLFNTVGCDNCRGSNKTVQFGKSQGASSGQVFPPKQRTPKAAETCPVCLGDSYHVPITVRPRSKAFEPLDYPEELRDVPVRPQRSRLEDRPDTEVPSDVLAWVKANDMLAAAAIHALLGPFGDQWAQTTWGRRFALWPLTEAGQKLAEESKFKPADGDWFTQQLDVLRDARMSVVQEDNPSPRVRALIGLADSQARALEQRAEQALLEAEAA